MRREPDAEFRRRFGVGLEEAVAALHPLALELAGGHRIEATELVVATVETMLDGPRPTVVVEDLEPFLRLQLVRYVVESLHKVRPVDDLWLPVERVVGAGDARLLWLHFVEGFSYRDIAAADSTTCASTERRVRRAVRRLRNDRERKRP